VRKNPTNNRILLAVAKSDQMNQLQRNLWIKLALIKFTKTDLPPSSYVGLITFNGDKVDFRSNSSSVKWKTAAEIDTSIIFGDTAAPIDFENLLTKGKEAFSTADPKFGGVFVIVIGGIGIKPNQIKQIETVANELRSLNVKLKIIVYPVFTSPDDRKYASQLFKKAISITGGSIVHIREDKILEKSSVSNFAQLLNALESVKTDFATNFKHSYYMVEEKIFKNPKDRISMSINVDSTLKNQQLNIYFIQSKYDFNSDSAVLIKHTIHLKDPENNADYELKSFIPSLGYIQGFTVNNIKEGNWELSAQAMTGASDESVIALAKFDYINSNDELPIVAKCWLSSEVEHNPSKPLLVYVQVNKAIYELIQEAVVEVELIYEIGQTFSKYELLDNGLGDPDITKGDGIYSQYIVDIRNQGYYQINATVKDRNGKVKVAKNFGSTSLPAKHTAKTCCGSKIESGSDESISFSRIVDCGSILITDNFITSNYPPNTIRDLQIESVDYFNRTVDLLWTSPGGDYTHNQVNKYDIKVFHGSESDSDLRNDIKSKFDSISSAHVEIEPISVAQRYGEQQRTQVKVRSEAGGMYYIAIKSYDKEGHSSDVSNIVVAYIKSNVVMIQSTTAFAIDVSKAPGSHSDYSDCRTLCHDSKACNQLYTFSHFC
jgi:predicted RNA-binding protein